MRVLYYLRNLNLGGTEKTCQLFIAHASTDIEVHLAYEETGSHPRLNEFDKTGCPMWSVHSYHDRHKPDHRDLQLVIDDNKIDILHVYRSGYQEFPEPGLHIKVPHFVETNVFGHVDQNPLVERSLFMSKWLMQHALRGQPFWRERKRFDFINNPVEEPYTDVQHPFRDKIPEDAIILGRCGRPDNGIYNAINVHAANLLRLQGYDVRFMVVAPPSNMIKDLAEYGIPFYVIEPTTDPLVLSTFYNAVDIYAHARADGETFGVNIAEAMMHGKPVVTHIATPSFSGMGVFQAQTQLVENGITGYVVDNEVGVYTEVLKLLIDNPTQRHSFGQAGKKKAMEEFHVDVCVKKLADIYRGVVYGRDN